MIHSFIDKLTRSIEETATGQVFDTEVHPADGSDIVALDYGWLFDWKGELGRAEVYKLIVPAHGSLIHGLVSLSRLPGCVVINLLESHPMNVGQHKAYVGVAGNLFAFAAKISFELGNEGFVAFEAKSELMQHYEKTLGARRIGMSQRMFLDTAAAKRLVATYFGEK